jgi:hypothetical protein
VDAAGNPLRPQWEPGAGNWGVTPYAGQLRYASVFGTITNLNSLLPDCSNVQYSGTWDPARTGMDPSGYIADFLQKLPAVNNYDIGDGLNTAGYRWSRTAEGADNLYGVGEDTYRKQINIRIDHSFNDKHRLSTSWSYEKNHAEDTLRQWPTNSWSGGAQRRPQVLTVNFISNAKATLLNEFKFGMSRTGSNVEGPLTFRGQGDALKQYLAQFGSLANGEFGVIEPGMGLTGSFRTDGNANLSTPYGSRGFWAIGDMLDTSPRYTWGDTFSWVKGSHSLRFGAEVRRSSSSSRAQWLISPSFQWGDSFPEYQGGELGTTTPQTFTNVVGDIGGSDAGSGDKRAMRDLLVFLSGSLSQVKQARYINNINQTSWNDPLKEPYMVRNTIMNEVSLFAKDDWKVTQSLNLNLGLRYDYYGVPHLGDGMTVGLTGGGDSIFGPTIGYSNWYAPIKRGDAADASKLISLRSIGPGGQHSGELFYAKSWRNIGPAVGFAYELPWLGKGKTSIRGGYQISYISMNQFGDIQNAAGQSPGFNYFNTWNNNGTWAAGDYFGIKDLKTNSLLANGIPVPSTAVPGLTTYALYDRTQSITSYASKFKYPYVQNITFAITRNVSSNLAVDLRYIGTLTRDNFSTKDINIANFLSNGLLGAFDAARRGEDPVLLDQLLNGLNLNPFGGCTVDGTTCKGGAALRSAAWPNFNVPYGAAGAFTNLNKLLAMGNYQGLANALNVESRSSIAGDPKGKYLEDNGFPVNFIKASPQFQSATIHENLGYSNYHSFQAQITLRPTHGFYFQTTYTWSKNLGNSGGISPDPRYLGTGYALLSSDRPHNWVTYGTFDLPFGPNRLIGSGSKGALGKAIGGWQVGWITTVQSGSPLNMAVGDATASNCMMYANCTPDAVNGGIKSTDMSWASGASNGSLFNNRYLSTPDPQCSNTSLIDPSIQSLCTLQAIRDTKSGNIVLQNPLPGHIGNVSYNSFRNLPRWNVDLSLSKAINVSESKSFQLRADITNAFNHVMPSGTLGASGTRITFPTAPAMNINGTSAIGAYTYKVGGRTLQAMARFNF